MAQVNDLGQWTIGQLYPNFEFVLVRDFQSVDLTNVTANQLSLIMYSASKVRIGTGTGAFAINTTTATPVVIYSQTVGDMATTGMFYYRVCINYGGVAPDYSDYIKIVVNP